MNKIVTDDLIENEKIEIIGPLNWEKRGGIFTFNIRRMNAHDVSKMLDASKNIMTRSGAFCVHSWFNAHGMKGAVRASFYLYNTEEETKIFVEEVKKIGEMA